MTCKEAITSALTAGMTSITTLAGLSPLAMWLDNKPDWAGMEGWEFAPDRPALCGPWSRMSQEAIRSIYLLS